MNIGEIQVIKLIIPNYEWKKGLPVHNVIDRPYNNCIHTFQNYFYLLKI